MLSLISCSSYHLRSIIPIEIKNITLNSYDPYCKFTSNILEEFHIRHITVFNNNNYNFYSMQLLKIVNLYESKVITSVFQYGKLSEYRIILTVQAQILMPSNDYNFNIQVYRLLIYNSLSAKDAEEYILRQEMRKHAAHQLVSKLLLTTAAF